MPQGRISGRCGFNTNISRATILGATKDCFTVCVIGGSGYIGSHMVKHLASLGADVTVLDNLSGGPREAALCDDFVEGELADAALLRDLFSRRKFDAVFHFASYIQVGESMRDPGKYYRNNVANTITLLEAMRAAGVPHLIFSSTAAVYGNPERSPIDEQHPLAPINPYGRSKLMVEQILADYRRAYGLKSVCLRYFNAAGADPEGKLGERHDPETHLIPLVLQAASGRLPHVSVFGRDYDTPDGTCIRDYIHVSDLCEAHWLALQALQAEESGKAASPAPAYNLGNGAGYSVQQVIDTARAVTGRSIKVVEGPRRAGDPARLVADASLARRDLGWQPRYGALEDIVRHAWQWERKMARF